MLLPPRIAKLFARTGWRRLTFAGFCLGVVVIGAVYLAKGPEVDSRGNWGEEIAVFRGVVKLAMLGFVLLAAASPLLIGRGKLAALAPSKIIKAEPGERRWFWVGVAVCTLASGLLWSQRMGRSIWNDELTSMRRVMVGRWKHKNDEGKFLHLTWSDTFFLYQTPNNHMAYSAAARVFHEKMGGVNEDDFTKPYFDAKVLRLPALISGLACIALIGYLALRLHSLLAAWLAMAWATLHPWMFEFSTSARGYAFGMVFLALAAVAAVKIFRRGGGWRWWAVYGLAQMLAFATIPTVLHGLVGLNLAVFLGLLFDRSVDPASRRGHLGAFFAANIVAGIVAIGSLYPRLEQLREYLGGEQFSLRMSNNWMVDCFSHLLIGQPFNTWATEEHPWAFSADQWPAGLALLGALFAAVLAVATLASSWRGGLFAVILALSFVVPHVTVFLQGIGMHFYLFPWYTAWGVPLVIAFFAIGAAALVTSVGKRLPRWSVPAAGVAFVLVLAAATHTPRTAYLGVPYEPMMESAASYRDSLNPWAPGHEKVLSSSLIAANHAYDPWNHRLRDAGDLEALIARADETGKPLYVESSFKSRIAPHYPDIAKILLDERYFEEFKHLYGIQPQYDRFVFRYLPGSMGEKTLTAEP